MGDIDNNDLIIQPQFENIDSFYFVKFNYHSESFPNSNSIHSSFALKNNSCKQNQILFINNNTPNTSNDKQTTSLVIIENQKTNASTYQNEKTNKQQSIETNNHLNPSIDQLVQKVFDIDKTQQKNLDIVVEQSPDGSNTIKHNNKICLNEHNKRINNHNLKQERIEYKEKNNLNDKSEIIQTNNNNQMYNKNEMNSKCNSNNNTDNNNKTIFTKHKSKGKCFQVKKLLCCFSSNN